MPTPATLQTDTRGASLIEFALLLMMVALIALLALPMLGVGVNRRMCDAIEGVDGPIQTWWLPNHCYSQAPGDDIPQVLF